MSFFTLGNDDPPSSSSFLQPQSRRAKAVATTVTVALIMSAGLLTATPALASIPMASTPLATTTSGSPGVAQSPTTIFTENFENTATSSDSVVGVKSYVGAAPLNETYTADANWLDPVQCNGLVVDANSFDPYSGHKDAEGRYTGCTYLSLPEGLAYTLGQVEGSATPWTNHAVAAITLGNPGAGLAEFETVNPIPLSAANRFLTFSVAAAATNCYAKHPLLDFYLVSAGVEIPTFSTGIDPCSDAGSRPYGGGYDTHGGVFYGNKAVLFSGSSLGITMRNAQESGWGNDGAFDDIKIQDVTPQLDQSISPAVVAAGTPATLTFTVTNTSEKGEKDGFSFSDVLPSGLSVASGNSTSSCGSLFAAPASGATALALTGSLNLGQATCEFSVPVVSAVGGTYVNSSSAITTNGLNNPGSASFVSITATAANLSASTAAATSVATPVVASATATFSGVNAASLAVLGAPSNGTATVLGASIIYTPVRAFLGNDSYTYQICSNAVASACATATVTVTVTKGALASIVISPKTTTPTSSVTSGGTGTFTTEGFDAANNSLGDVTANTVFTSTTGTFGAAPKANVLTYAKSGLDIIKATYGGFSDTSAVVVTLTDVQAATQLGTAAGFSVLAGAATTIPGGNVVGDIGAKAALTVTDTKVSGNLHGSSDDATIAALADLSSSYVKLKALPAVELGSADLGGMTILPGVYHSVAALAATSTVTFDAKGDPNAYFIIQSDAALNTTAATAMVLVNGAKSSNIFWVTTGAATLGAASTFDGIIISNAAITLGAGSTLNGRAYSVTAAITLGAISQITAGINSVVSAGLVATSIGAVGDIAVIVLPSSTK